MGAGRGAQRRIQRRELDRPWDEDQKLGKYKIEVRETPADGLPSYLAQHCQIPATPPESQSFTISQSTFAGEGVPDEEPSLQAGGTHKIRFILPQKTFEDDFVRALSDRESLVITPDDHGYWHWYDTRGKDSVITIRRVLVSDVTTQARAAAEDPDATGPAVADALEVLRVNAQISGIISNEDAANVPTLLRAMDENAKAYEVLVRQRTWGDNLRDEPVDVVTF